MQRHHPLVGRLTPPAPFLLPARFRGRLFGRAGGGALGRDGARSLGQDSRMAGQAALQDLACVLQEMKAVGDLFGLRRPQRRSGSVVPTPIATDEPHLGMLAQPERKTQVRAVGQQINDATAFKVEEDGAIGAAAPEGKVIHAQHAHRRHPRFRPLGQQTQDRLIGDPHAQGGGDRFGAATSGSHPQRRHLFYQADGLACPRTHIVR